MIIRTYPNKDWTRIHNMVLRDKKLSLKAKGLMAYLLTLPDDWDVHFSELLTHHTDGERSTRGAMRELFNEGYVQMKIRREGGHIAGNDYYIFEDKIPHVINVDGRNVNAQEEALLSTNKILNTKRDIYVTLLNYKKPIEVLNISTGRAFKTDNLTYLGEIRARVKEGSPIEEICEVVKFICKQRMGTEWEKFLRPSTVFNKTKYESYVAEYRYLTKDGKYAILNNGNGNLKDLA